MFLDAEPNPDTLYKLIDLYREVSAPELPPYSEPQDEPLPELEREPVFPEPVDLVEEEQAKEDRSNSLKIVRNEHVEREIRAYSGHLRKAFAEGLARAGRYLPIIREMIEHEGLPPEIAYLPLVESNFKVLARSPMGAAGLWQFMPSTARNCGLTVGWGDVVDERYDIEKSTYAAVRHLSNLYNLFDSWELALAAYNAGETRVFNGMINGGYERDYWKIMEGRTKSGRRHLPRETLGYVPKFMAAVVIAQSPEEYGFAPIVENALQYEKMLITGWVDLGEIARACGVTLTTMRELNPELKVAYTPNKEGGYELKIPAGTRDKLEVALAKMPVTKGVESFRHRVGRGETLSGIADRYGTSVRAIKMANNLRSDLIRAGKHLIIPAGVRGGGASIPPTAERTAEELVYTVKRGDTLWGISQAFKVSLSDLRRWNAGRLRGGDGRRLSPGDKIIVRVKSAPQTKLASSRTGEIKYVVKRRDNLWDISRKYGVTVSAIMKRNNLRSSRIDVGDELIIPTK